MILTGTMVVPAKERQTRDVCILAIDLAKPSFQVSATDRGGAVRYNRTAFRAKLEQMLETQVPCIVAIEACAISQFWGVLPKRLGTRSG